jgi:tRNA(Ile)-lysidine synthase
MRILRGTGLYGLAGILPKRTILGFQFIRPLLGISRKEIEGFLQKRRIAFLLDRTNSRDIYLRNKLRNRLLPLLEKDYNKNIKEALCNLGESSGLDYDYLYAVARKKSKGTANKFNSKKLLRLHPAIRRMVLRLAIARIAGDTRRLKLKNIREIEDLLYHRPLNAIVDLPKGISVVKKKTHLLFYRR